MNGDFDPYQRWLKIPPNRRPPSYYDLLGVPDDERDLRRIDDAAAARMAKVRARALGERGDLVTPLLNQLSQALDCLVNSTARKAYDQARLQGLIDDWLQDGCEAADFYQILDTQQFAPDRVHLLALISLGRRYLASLPNLDTPRRERAMLLSAELERAETALSGPSAFQQYHRPILARLWNRYVKRHGDDSSRWGHAALCEWLERHERVHPDRSQAIAWAMFDAQAWDPLLIELFPVGRGVEFYHGEFSYDETIWPARADVTNLSRRTPPELPASYDDDGSNEVAVSLHGEEFFRPRSMASVLAANLARCCTRPVLGLAFLGCVFTVAFFAALFVVSVGELDDSSPDDVASSNLSNLSDQFDSENSQPRMASELPAAPNPTPREGQGRLPDALLAKHDQLRPVGGGENTLEEADSLVDAQGRLVDRLIGDPERSLSVHPTVLRERLDDAVAPAKAEELASADGRWDPPLVEPERRVEPLPAMERERPPDKHAPRTFSHSGPLRQVTWSPDGKYLAVAANRTVKIWDALEGNEFATLDGHSRRVADVAWCPSNPNEHRREQLLIATASEDRSVRVFDLAAASAVPKYVKANSPVSCLTWSPDGRRLAAGLSSGDLFAWNLAHGGGSRHRSTSFRSISAIAWHPNEPDLVVIGDEEGLVWVWDLKEWLPTCGRIDLNSASVRAMMVANPQLRQLVATGALPLMNRPAEICRKLAWSPNGSRLAAVENGIELWNFRVMGGFNWSATQLKAQPKNALADGPPKPADEFTTVAWCPDGRRLAGGTAGGEVVVFDASTGRQLFRLACPTEAASISWSPDGRQLAAGSSDGTLTVWIIEQ